MEDTWFIPASEEDGLRLDCVVRVILDAQGEVLEAVSCTLAFGVQPLPEEG